MRTKNLPARAEAGLELHPTRKPRARRTEIVIAAIEERLLMLTDATDAAHKERLLVLVDELNRSLNGKEDE